MTPPLSAVSDDEFDRLLADRLQDEVADVVAGADLLERIRRDDTEYSPLAVDGGSGGRRRMLPLAAAAAAVVLVVAAVAVAGRSDETEVATDGGTTSPRPTVVVDGVSASGPWEVLEYVESSPRFVDVPTTCLRFEPPIEPGPFFCGTREDLISPHGRMVLRPGRLGNEQVFVGVLSPEVARVNLTIDGARTTVEPDRWESADLGIVVVTVAADPEVQEWNIEMFDADGTVLSSGGGNTGG